MDAPESPWGTSPYQQAVTEGTRRSWLRWVVVAATAAVLVGAGTALYLYLTAASALPVSLTIESQPLMPGSPSEMTLVVTNASQADTARQAELAIRLPARTVAKGLQGEAASSTPEAPVLELGDIAPGDSANVTITLDTQLDPSSAVTASADLTYATDRDLGTRFSVVESAELVVREAALTLAVDAPGAVVRDAPFDVAVRYRNNTDKALTGAQLVMTLPRGLTVVSSSPALSGGRLSLQTLAARQAGTLKLTLLPGSGAAHDMLLRAEVIAGGATLAEREADVAISSDALSVSITVAGKEEAVVSLDQQLQYDIVVKNLSSVPLKDIKVTALLDSPFFVRSTVRAEGGSLSPGQPLVTWTGVGVEALRSLQPGGTVRVSMDVRFASSLGGASSVAAPVVATASSPTVPAGTSATGVSASDTALARLSGSTAFSAAGYWKDPLGQVSNEGPQPPRVGTATQYVIRWSVQPSGAGLKDAVVTAALPPGVRFTGKLGGVTAPALEVDSRTGQVTWRIGSVAANVLARAAFQLEITPAENQKGRSVRLIDGATLSASDAFTGTRVRQSASPISTDLGGGGGAGNGVVQ